MTTADLIPVIRELSRAEKLEIIEFLRSELEKEELQSILKPGASYPVWSPYDCHQAARVLEEMLEEHKKAGNG